MKAIKVKYISHSDISNNMQTLLEMYKLRKEYIFLVEEDIEVGSIIENESYDSSIVVTEVITEPDSVLQLYNNLKEDGIKTIIMMLSSETSLGSKKLYSGANFRYATDREPRAISQHWYSCLRKKTNCIFMTVSGKKCTVNGKNVVILGDSITVNTGNSVWGRIKRFLGL